MMRRARSNSGGRTLIPGFTAVITKSWPRSGGVPLRIHNLLEVTVSFVLPTTAAAVAALVYTFHGCHSEGRLQLAGCSQPERAVQRRPTGTVTNTGLTLGQRRRRWTSSKPALV